MSRISKSLIWVGLFAAQFLSAAQKPAVAAPPAAPGLNVKTHLRSLGWRSVGPANMGGRISELAFVPGTSHQFFAATATGGVFKTMNGGTTFKPVFDDQPVLSTGSIAIAPSDPKIIWVGSGEGNGRNSSSWGDGIYKSTDGGDSFTNMGLKESRDIPRLAIHPKNADMVYAAAMGALWNANRERGLYKTSDGGKSWAPILQIDENHGCMDVRLDPNDPEVVYAVMYARRRLPWSFQSGGFGDKGGIYKSVDGGKSFAKLAGGLPLKTGRIGLDLFAAKPGHLFAIIEADDAGSVDIESNTSPAGGVFKSEDGGATWSRQSSLAPRSFYFGKITVDPKDENRLYVGGYRFYISDDGGKNFRPNGARIIHGDVHSLVVDPLNSDHLLLGEDGGIYESWDRAKSWRFHNNIPLGQFYEIGLGMDQPYTICGGLQDNGTWCGPSRGRTVFGESEEKQVHLSNEDWDFIWGGDGYFAAIDPRDPAILYTESQEGWAGRTDRKSGRVKFMHPTPKEGSAGFRFNWDSPLLMSKHDPEVVYLGGNRLFKYTNKGEKWEMISPDLSSREVEKVITTGSGAESHGTIVALSESPRQAGLLWAGTDDGNLHLTRNEGKNWEKLAWPAGVPAATWVSRLDASHTDLASALVSFDGHRTGDNKPYIYATSDYGRSWKNLSAGLPAGEPVKVVREAPGNPALLFAGTERGIVVSFDRGGSWQSLRGESLPAIQVHDLQIHPREKDLVIGTHGRSIYILDDISGLEQLSAENRAKPAVLLTPRPATGWYMTDRGGVWGHDQWAAKNPKMGASLNYWVKERNFDGVKIEIAGPDGRVIRELEGPAEAGLNRLTWDLARKKEERVDEPEVEWAYQTPFVPAGEYTVTLTMGKEKSTAKLMVGYPPGVGPETGETAK